MNKRKVDRWKKLREKRADASRRGKEHYDLIRHRLAQISAASLEPTLTIDSRAFAAEIPWDDLITPGTSVSRMEHDA